MLFSDITLLNDHYEIIPHAFVATEGDTIAYVGTERPEGDFGREYDGKGRLLMSGFINAHAHSPMTLMRGYGENLKLQSWLNDRIFPFEAQLDSNAVYWGTMLSMAESLQYGIVSTSDMYYFCEDIARAVADSGAKANISRSLTNFTGQEPQTMESFKEMKVLYENYHNAENGRIKIDMSLHGEYTSDPRTAKALAEYAAEIGDTIMHIHVSETASEHEECIQRHGMSPAAYLESMGLFDVPALAAHCVYSTEDDIEIFRRKGVTVATNPVSNMKLASGICDVSRILEKGVNVAIGTDSVASNNSLDFFEEMKVLAIGNKVAKLQPEIMTPLQIIKAATEGGAKAQGRADCGRLAAGAKADLIAIDIASPNMHPVHDMINNLVYSCGGRAVTLTMVDGKVLYENGEFTTIDIEKTIYEAEKATEGILKKL
ncbi:MAG: amidohydrolase [Bacillota bacterium]|nr:amidohydrolase [Bacillota bacterium]